MHETKLRNIFLVARREYLEAVRTKLFVIMTLLMPTLMLGFSVGPSLLMTVKSGKATKVTIATMNQEYGDAIRDRILHGKEQVKTNDNDSFKKNDETNATVATFAVSVTTDLGETNKKHLFDQIDNGQLDGFLWLDEKAIADHRADYYARETSNFIQINSLENSIHDVILHKALVSKGLHEDDIAGALKPFDMQAIQWEKGHAKKSNEGLKFMSALFLTLITYMTVMMY